MKRDKFKLSHSLVGLALLIIAEGVLLRYAFEGAAAESLLCLVAIAGSITALYVATEIIEEVRSAGHMLLLLSMLVGEFVIFFAVQYWFLLMLEPGSFSGLATDPLSLLLASTMVFVFNPLYVPMAMGGRALLLLNTLAALGLVMFVLQNVGQFRGKA